MTLTCPAYAKLNLFLEVTGKRPDGFHNLESVFLAIDLADTLSAEPRDDGRIGLACDAPGMPPEAENLAVKAAAALRRKVGGGAGIQFHLEKRIPMGAGLGGGSSDAAAALVLTNRLWGTGLSRRELAEIGAGLGSDIPFFLYGGSCLCQGRGEKITLLPPCPRAPEMGVLVANLHSDTGAAYRGLSLPGRGEAVPAESFVAAWREGDAEGMRKHAFNRFEKTVFAAFPELGALHGALARGGHAARLSGSGSGMWFFGAADAVNEFLHTDPEARELAERLELRAIPVEPAASRVPSEFKKPMPMK